MIRLAGDKIPAYDGHRSGQTNKWNCSE